MQSRRKFLKTSAAATGSGLAVPYFFSTQKTLADESNSKNDRPTIGVIGAGGMGSGNINVAKRYVDVVAIADADSDRTAQFNQQHASGKADEYSDYRKVLERDDVDLIHIATPDHWHTKPLVEAMYAGKDVYCEKPLTLTIDEGKLIRKVQKETGRIVQVGTQQRSTFHLFVTAIAIVADGRLGKLKRVQAAIGGGPKSGEIPVAEVPKNLDWDLWLGPAPKVDYRSKERENKRAASNCHYEFRWWYEYSGGKLTDWGAHHVDICNWALKSNGQSDGPTGIRGSAEHPVEFDADGKAVQTDRYNTANAFQFTLDYPNGTELIIRHDTDNGCLFEGEKGRLFVKRRGIYGTVVDQLKENPLPEGALQAAYKGLPMEHNERHAHWVNFLHCAKEGIEPISDVHSHMQGLNLCHLAGIAARTGRDLKWDDAAEQIVGDDAANAMLSRPYRAGYEIEQPAAV